MQINVTGQSNSIQGYKPLEKDNARAVQEAATEAFEESLDDMRASVEKELKRRGVRIGDAIKTLGEWWQAVDEGADVREDVADWTRDELLPAMHYAWSDKNLAESLPEAVRAFADEEGLDMERFMRGFGELLNVVRAELNGDTYNATGEPEGEDATDAEVLRAVGLMYFGLSIDEEA